MGGAIAIAIILAIVVALFVINILKGKPGMAVTGIVIHVTWYIGAIRLAKPNSRWARRYYVGKNETKLQRAIARHGDLDRYGGSSPDIVREGWLAGTVPKGEGVPVQRKNPETGQWALVYVPPHEDGSTAISPDSVGG